MVAETKQNEAWATHAVEAIDLLDTAHRARLDFERDGIEVVALNQRNVGASRMERVGRLGDELQT